ncbi:sigma 54-interacting transcriptional regulator [Clostridium tagluense]|uniref:sigma 54-interacting transcriptional regulator n=1 Tax=Clostridium tagluense TaxID=360422 RepID=UPI002162045B|nr:sigma 54-interacting transcriptional regulator [Clostridium tagluense]
MLRVLQDKVVFPIGSIKGTKINVRFIAVTNKDLKQEVKTNNFRKDLFYRLNVIHISMPPLRERREDIPRLVDHFLKKYNILLSKDIKGISAKALQAIEKYKFDGNVRELQNIIERAVALTRDDFISLEDLPEDVFFSENIVSICDDIIPIYVGENMKSIERRVIEYNLKKFENSRKKTSESLGISERNLRYKIKEYN